MRNVSILCSQCFLRSVSAAALRSCANKPLMVGTMAVTKQISREVIERRPHLACVDAAREGVLCWYSSMCGRRRDDIFIKPMQYFYFAIPGTRLYFIHAPVIDSVGVGVWRLWLQLIAVARCAGTSLLIKASRAQRTTRYVLNRVDGKTEVGHFTLFWSGREYPSIC